MLTLALISLGLCMVSTIVLFYLLFHMIESLSKEVEALERAMGWMKGELFELNTRLNKIEQGKNEDGL